MSAKFPVIAVTKAARLVAWAGIAAYCWTYVVYEPRSKVLTEAHAVHFSSAEFITIVLTALTAILACLAIILALAGVVGYAQIRAAAEAVADAAAREIAQKTAAEVAERVTLESQVRLSSVEGGDTGDGIAKAEGN